jgi:hypothetical protein
MNLYTQGGRVAFGVVSALSLRFGEGPLMIDLIDGP